jgi:pseudaminic acid synthase
MKINNKVISENNKPYIIAEFSGNHNGDINNFMKLIDVAKNAGADAVKLQTFKPEKITLNSSKKFFLVKHKFKKWNNKTLYDLYKDAYTPWEWHEPILKKAKKNNLDFISTPFHNSAVDFLNKIGVSSYKIASFEFNDHGLIEYTSKMGRPMILSTGMASKKEIDINYKILNKRLKNNFAFLKCSSSYPARIEDLNLNTIDELKKNYKCPIGYSDHSEGDFAAITAIAKGSCIIEKHICLDRKTGIDSDFSQTPEEFIKFVKGCRDTWLSLGKIKFGPTTSEKESFKNRRSLFAIKNIKKNEKFTDENIASIRPAKGLKPIYLKKIIGKKSQKKFNEGDPITLKF